MGTVWALILTFLCAAEAQILFPTDETEQYANSFGQCLTPEKERSACVYLQDCQVLYNLLTKVPLTDNDKLYLRQSQCGYYSGKVLPTDPYEMDSLKVCCPPRSGNSPSTPNVTPSQNFGNTEMRVGVNLLPQPGVCGTGSTDRIYGGNRTKIDEYPWMALLEYTKPGNRKGHHCGGVLISERYVLTASHCVNGRAIPVDWALTGVRLGEWDLSTDRDCEEDDCSDPVQDIQIERAIPHEQYNPSSRSQLNDIALLRLVRSIRFTDWIKPICLPIGNAIRNALYDGINLDVAGWGKTETSSVSNIKLKARVDGVPLAQCKEVYSKQNVELEATQICAGGVKGVDSCRGDSGGPLIGVESSNKNRPYFFLVGVVSFGPTPCGLENWPGVYTRVGAYMDWIESHLSP